MFGFKIDQAKSLFFDRPKVLAAADRATQKALSKFGAFVRQRARTSIRRRNGVSQPDSPPSSHTGLLRQNIFFVYEPGKKSVVIGPARLNGRLGDAPAALEYGGETVVRTGTRRRSETRTVRVRPRPYMQPAFEKELPNAAKLLENSVTP